MQEKLFKNISYLFFNTLYSYLIYIISGAIFLRIIGLDGFAIIGIVSSFFCFITLFDLRYTISLVKNNMEVSSDMDSFNDTFNTLLNSVILSNFILFFILSPVIIFLSLKVYAIPHLLSFYFLGFISFLIRRVSYFLHDFMRANKHEKTVSKGFMVGQSVFLITSLLLMIISGLGVYSMFLGEILGLIIELFILFNSLKAFISYKLYFSLDLFKRLFKKYIFFNILVVSSSGFLIHGGLFLSSFFLSSKDLGVLTIIVYLNNKFFDIFINFTKHLNPIYSKYLIDKNYKSLVKNLKVLLFIFLSFSAFFAIFLFTIGEPILLLYYGNNISGYYFFFMMILMFSFINILSLPIKSFYAVKNIRFNSLINILSALFFVILFLLFGLRLKLLGVTLSYSLTYIFTCYLSLLTINRFLNKAISFKYLLFFSLLIIFMSIASFVYFNNLYFSFPASLLFFLILSAILILSIFNKLRQSLRYITENM